MVSEQPRATGALAEYPYDEKLASRFRLTDRFDNPYLLYEARDGKLFLPRAFCPLGVVDRRIVTEDIAFDMKYPPRNDEQDRVICETYAFLQKGQSGIVQAPTGMGKSYCALFVTALMRQRTLIVVTKSDLFDQWIDSIHQFMGLPYDKIGRIRQDKLEVLDKPIAVGMIHSLSIKGKYPDWLRKMYGLVHYDEVQRLPADEFSKVAGMFASKWRLGWSATPDRADGREPVFKGHIGPVRVVSDAMPMVPEVYRYRTQFKLPMVPRTIKGVKRVVQLPHQPGKIAHVVKLMAKDFERNRLIAKLGSMCYKDGRKAVLFSDSLEHLETMRGLIMNHGVKPSDIGWYVGGISKQDKADAASKKVLLATYQFMSEGSDVPTVDACIMMSPRSDVRQIVGRVLRFLPDKRTPVVIDLIDTDSNVLCGYADKRRSYYSSVGAKVTDVS